MPPTTPGTNPLHIGEQHPPFCVMQREWGALGAWMDAVASDVSEIKKQTTATNGRVTRMERRWRDVGVALAVLFIVNPLLTALTMAALLGNPDMRKIIQKTTGVDLVQKGGGE